MDQAEAWDTELTLYELLNSPTTLSPYSSYLSLGTVPVMGRFI